MEKVAAGFQPAAVLTGADTEKSGFQPDTFYTVG